MNNNIITYEQAINIKKLDEVVETFQEIAMTMMKYFSSNTLAQMTQTQFYYDLMDVTQAYFQKDYSQYLFKQTTRMYDEFEVFSKDVEKATETFSKMSGLYTKLIIENKINIK